jgi:ABC-type branched-subunit amino acid transport system permease subunit
MMLALAIVFLSIVAVTGFSGHITLGQAAFAGFGGFATARVLSTSRSSACLGCPWSRR